MLPGALSGCTGSSDEWQGRPLVCGTDSNLCCRAYNADCLSCAQGLSVDEFCRQHLQDFVPGCEHVIEPLCPVALNGCDGAWGSFNYVQFNTRHTVAECRDKCESSNGDCEVYFHNKLNGRCLLMLPGALSGCTGSSDEWQGRPLVCGTDSNLCCRAYNADCLSCAQGLSVDEFCRQHPEEFVPGCEHVMEPLCPVALNGCDGAWGSFNYVQFNTRHTAEECREKCESSNG